MDKYQRLEAIALGGKDFNFFAALCLPDVMEFDFPPEYIAMTHMVEEAALDTSKADHNFALGLPRGFAKTTWAKIFCAWLFCYTDRQYALCASSNEGKAESFIADVARILRSRNLSKLFGSYDDDAEKDTAGLKIFKYRGKTRILHAVGANGDPRGYNIEFKRPDIHILDDVQSRKNAKSEAESKSLLEWYASTFYLTKAPTGLLHLYIGNTFPYEGCILSKLRDDPNYTSFVVGGILANGESLWPELNSKEKLKADFKRSISLGQGEVFLSEIMNDKRSYAALGFDYSKTKAWDVDDHTPAMSGFIIIDVAGDKNDSDDTAIGAALFYDSITLPYFRDLDFGKFSPLETIKHAMKMAVRHNIQTIFIEGVAYQSSLAFWAEFICKQLGIEGFQFIPINPRRVPKNVRIMDSLRKLQNGEIVLHPDIAAIVQNKISSFDPSTTNNSDDILDLLDYMVEIPLKHQHEISLLIDVLSGTKAPSSYDFPAAINCVI